MKYARVINSTVIETFVEPTGFTIDQCFTPELVAQFVPCSNEVEPNWLMQENGEFIAPPVVQPSESPTVPSTNN